MSSPTTEQVRNVFHPFSPRDRYGSRVDPTRCRASVPMGGRSVDFHQCLRVSVRTLGGFGLCEQHAREVEVKLGLRPAPVRPPTKYERELATMRWRADYLAALEEAVTLAGKLCATDPAMRKAIDWLDTLRGERP